MSVPLSYTWRSLWARHITTALTLVGIALVVFVFASILMLATGIERTLVTSGDPQNVIILRRAANSELVSQVGRDEANILKTHPQIAIGADGKPVASTETVVIINLQKIGTNDMGNILVRGVSAEAFALRPQVQLTAGRMFSFGSDEIIIGENVARRFQGAEIGRQIRIGEDQWTIVGVFGSGGTAFESEVWADVEVLMPSLGRPSVFSSITMRMNAEGDFQALKDAITADPRTQSAEVKLEQQYYREQSETMSNFIRVLGLVVTIIFALGAVIGAVITMFAAVANRTVEIGTMRALGFRRGSILKAFLFEAILLSIIGGIAGLLLASLTSFIQISTTNFGSFSELAFGFTLSPAVIFLSLAFAVLMGIAGGFFPAVRAARLSILSALRSD
jgi:ABC-type lipoprotein release transport system permease subunit